MDVLAFEEAEFKPYESIVNLPHYVSSKRKAMPMETRAAQFAPFAALTAHEVAIAEIDSRMCQPFDPDSLQPTRASLKDEHGASDACD